MSTSSADHLRLVAPASNLAAPGTRLRGRRHALAGLQRWLDGAHDRLRVLCGPPGVGKTRLALALGAHLLETGRGRWAGCWFVDLAAARDEHAVIDTVASALGATLPRFAPLEAARVALAAHLRAAGRTLLVLDNLEQLDDDAVAALRAWPAALDSLTLLATSRRSDRFAPAQLVALEPLELPHDGHRGSAFHLFVDHARVVLGATWAPKPGETRDIEQIVSTLHGLPLAIELAARRLLILSPAQIAERLERCLDLLEDPAVVGTPRTLRAAIETSWALLETPVQQVLARCGVFRGSFDLRQAEDVLVGDDTHVLNALQTLAAASLVEVERGAHCCYRLLVPIREFATEKLAALDPDGHALARHRRHCARHTLELLELLELSTDHTEVERLGAMLDELCAVIERVLDTPEASPEQLDDALACALGLDVLARRSSAVTAPARLIGRLLARTAHATDHCEPHLHVRLLTGAWRMLRVRAPASDCAAVIERAMSLAEASGEPALLARACHGLAVEQWSRGRRDEALQACARAREAAQHSGHAVLEGQVAVIQAWLEYDEGRPAQALRTAEACLRQLEACGAWHEWSLTAANLAVLCYQSGALDAALALHRQVLPRCRSLRDVHLESRVLTAVSGIESLLELPDFDAHHRACLELAQRHGDRELEVGTLVRGAWHAIFSHDAHDEAIELMSRALALHRRGGNLRMIAYTLQSTAELWLVLGRPELAHAPLEEALSIASSACNTAQHAVLLSMQAALEQRDWQRARTLVEQARAAAASSRDEKLLLGIELESVYVDACHGMLEGELDAPRARTATATLIEVMRHQPPPFDLPGPARPCWQRARYMRAATRRTLAVLPPALAARAWADALDPEQAQLVDVGDGATFRLPGGRWLELGSTPTLARVFATLVECRRQRGTQERVSFETCIAAGWADERILYDAALNRLHQVLSRLRRKGLRDIIENVDGGYRIAPTTPVVGVVRV